MENVMKSYFGLGLATLAGAAFGAVAVNGLNAQGKAGAYVIVDISEVTNPDQFKTLLPKAPPAVAAFNGQFLMLQIAASRTPKLCGFWYALAGIENSRDFAAVRHE
jgi:hypothetical protein